MTDNLLSEQELYKLMKGGSDAWSEPVVQLSFVSSLMKHFGISGEDAAREVFGQSVLTVFRPAGMTTLAQAVGQLGDSGGLVLACELTGALAGVCVLLLTVPDAEELLRRAVGTEVSDGELLNDEGVSVLGELLLAWLTEIISGVGEFLQEKVHLKPQMVAVLKGPQLSQLPFGQQEPIVQVPVEWSFSDAVSVTVWMWLPVDTTQELVSDAAAALQSGRRLVRSTRHSKPNGNKPVRVYPFRFDSFSPQAPAEEESDVDVLADVSLEVVIELGRSRKRIGDILDWDAGTVISLDKLAGESVEVYVNGHVIARGEVMVVDGRLAVRIVEILSRQERLGEIL